MLSGTSQQPAAFADHIRYSLPSHPVGWPTVIPRARGAVPGAASVSPHANQATLSRVIGALGEALSAPAVNHDWRESVSMQLHALRVAFDEHIALTEGPDGLYAELVTVAPRLARTVQRLAGEHSTLAAHMAVLQSFLDSRELNIDQLRECGAELVRELKLHRQHGADLIYEAYATDLGGET